MGDGALLGLLALSGIIVGGMLLARALLSAIFPIRARLFEIGSELANDPSAARSDRRLAEFFLDTATCFDAGWMVLIAVRLAVVEKVNRNSPGAGKVAAKRDRRLSAMGPRYIVSALVANPFALVLFVPMFSALLLLDRRPKKALRDAGAHIRPRQGGLSHA